MYAELAYILGVLLLALGTAFMEATDFGVSMVVAPAYVIFLKVSEIFPFFTFGMAEYSFQALLLVLLMLFLRQFRISYLFSFVTAVFYGFTLDGCMSLVGLLSCDTMFLRILFYIIGMLLCAAGVSLLFHSYVPPEVYELTTKEIAAKYKRDVHRVKTVYDCISCALGIILSFIFFGFGEFRGVKLGTIICACINGTIIGLFSRMYNKVFIFKVFIPRFRKNV